MLTMAAEPQRAASGWRRLLPALTLLGLVAAVWHAAAVTAAERAERAVVVVADQNAFLGLLGAPAVNRPASRALARAAAAAGGSAAAVSATGASATGAAVTGASATAVLAYVAPPKRSATRAAVTRASAAGTHLTPRELFSRLKAAGAGAVGVSETGVGTFAALGNVALVDGATWQGRVRAGLTPAPGFPLSAQATYVLVRQRSVADWLRSVLPLALGPQVAVRWYVEPGGLRVAMVPVAGGLLTGMPLGFAPGSFALARSVGLAVVPRPANSLQGMSTAAALSLYRRVAAARVPVAGMIFAGAATQPVPGGAAAAPPVAAIFRANRWPLGVVRLSGGIDLLPPGMNSLAARLPGSLVRVYSVPALAAFTPGETRRLAQDIRAADARVVYVHPVVGAADPVATSLAYIASLTRDLAAQGLVPASRPALLPPLAVGTIQRLVQALGAAAGVVWLLCLWLPAVADRRLLLTGAVSVVVLAGCALLPGAAGAAVLGTVGGVVAAGLGAAAAARVWPAGDQTVGPETPRALWVRAAVVGLVWAGALSAGGLFAVMVSLDARGLLGWPASTGAGVVHLAALLLALVAFSAAAGPGSQGWDDLWRRLAQWADRPITFSVRDAVVAVVVLAVVAVLRHKAIDIWVYDLRAPWREAAARFLLAPPSERAALVGFPAVLAAAWTARRNLRWGFLVALLVAAYGMAPFFDLFSNGVVPLSAVVVGGIAQAALGLAAAAAALVVTAVLDDLWRRRRLAASGPIRPSAAETLQPGPP